MLQNDYLLAKIGVDTAENEPRIASLAVVAMDPQNRNGESHEAQVETLVDGSWEPSRWEQFL